jgi:hypothetical protein
MTRQRRLLGVYRILLQFYPPAFRSRFAKEMLELAEAAEPGEWALMFGDTSLGIVRCWLERGFLSSAVADPNAYIPLGESTVLRWRLLQGFVLSVAILIGLCYFSDWTAYRECPGTTSESASARR